MSFHEAHMWNLINVDFHEYCKCTVVYYRIYMLQPKHIFSSFLNKQCYQEQSFLKFLKKDINTPV